MPLSCHAYVCCTCPAICVLCIMAAYLRDVVPRSAIIKEGRWWKMLWLLGAVLLTFGLQVSEPVAGWQAVWNLKP